MPGMPEASDLGVVPGGRALGHLGHGRVEKEVREVVEASSWRAAEAIVRTSVL